MEKGSEKGSGRVRLVEIDERSAGQRIDNYLRRLLKGVPATRLYRGLRKGEVRVNGSRIRPSYRLAAGDTVRIPPLRRPERGQGPAPDLPPALRQRLLRPVYEDADLLVLDKPSGLAVHGGSGLDYGLIEALRVLRPETPFLELAHRLDRETSGCLLLAKSRRALLGLHEQLRAHDEGRADDLRKRYLALLAGPWEDGRRVVSTPLRRTRADDGRRRVVEDAAGQPSTSRFEPLRRFEEAALVRVALLTGRMHQVRVHAAGLGRPVAGDDLYGDWQANRRLRKLGLRRLFLHAESLSLQHPVSGARLEFSVPLPPELEAVLDRLQGGAP